MGATPDFVRSIAPRLLVANLAAALVVYAYLAVVSPPASGTEESTAFELVTFGAYVIVAAVIGLRAGKGTFAAVARWLDEARPPNEQELEITLEQPLRQSAWVLIAWGVGAFSFAALHAFPGNPIHQAPDYGVFIGAVSILGGLTAAMLTYLLVEYNLRPIFAVALERAPISRRPRTLGVKQRIVVAWALGSGVATIAIALTPFASPRLREAIWFLAPVGLIAGGLLVMFAARSVASPVARMRSALARVEEGDLDVRVVVDDASEVGLLQAGFNRMVAGLQERERLRSIFGTYVDRDVAEHILNEGTSLAGEEVDVTIMFIDVRDFTGFVERVPAQEVVRSINRLFDEIVPIIHECQGHVDKFVGDGLLAVFGAPRRSPNHADLAVRAATAMVDAVHRELRGELKVGIGINSGRVISGNVGGGGRLEFSVIGDAVNVAARIEGATKATGDTILISETTRALIRDTEFLLEERTDVHLKGKARPVCVYAVKQLPDRGETIPSTPRPGTSSALESPAASGNLSESGCVKQSPDPEEGRME